MKKGFADNLEEETKKNTDFRRVLYTGKFSQLVLMCLKPNEDIGMEVPKEIKGEINAAREGKLPDDLTE